MSVRKEIESWGPQMGEHALFLHMLLYEPTLKQRALNQFYLWKSLVCTEMSDPVAIMAALQDLEALKMEILERLNKGEWLGSVFPQFVDHILKELRYFKRKLNGQTMTAAEEIQFWNEINSEHAGFAAHLLDPTEEKLVDEADATSKRIRMLPAQNSEAAVILAMEAGVDLHQFNSKAYDAVVANKIKSIIPPTLLKHVVREGEIGNNVLGQFIGGTEAPLIRADICFK